MLDRENVIKGLECCIDLQRGTINRNCEDCPYNDDVHIGSCKSLYPLLEDALVLLKEQEKIINEYHKADAFLAAHGWEWKHD